VNGSFMILVDLVWRSEVLVCDVGVLESPGVGSWTS
jgi:hypothetical protein